MFKIAIPADPRGRIMLALKTGAALVAAGALAVGVYRITVLPGKLADQAADVAVLEETFDATEDMAAFAQDKIIHHYDTQRVIDQKVQEGIDDVYAAEGGDAQISPELDAAGRRALCLHDAYRSANDCDRLQPDDYGTAAQADPFGDGTGGR